MTMDSTENHPGKPIGVYDYVAIAAYFIGILLVGYFVSRTFLKLFIYLLF